MHASSSDGAQATRRTLLKTTLALPLAGLAGSSGAQAWPARDIRLVLPSGAGGGADIFGRPLAEFLGKNLGVPVVVENRPGANGIVAHEAVLRAPADGHSLLISFSAAYLVNRLLMARMSHDPLTDFVPVGHAAPIGSSPYGVIAVAVPQTSAQVAMPIEPGDWTLVFATPAGRVTRARAYLRTSVDGEFHGGTLSVRIYIPDGLVIQDPEPAHAITAAMAATDPCVAARVDSFFATLEKLFDLGRGNVEFIAIGSAFDAIESDAARLGALAETVAPSAGFAAHFVWTTRVELFGTRVWANSAWVPGTATYAGHALSGIAVDVSAGKPAAADGMTMLHELGHFLGLFHTTEANPAIHDPLSDTPTCTSNASTCPDARNIMFPLFWGATGGVGLEATAQQRRVVHGSPLYDTL